MKKARSSTNKQTGKKQKPKRIPTLRTAEKITQNSVRSGENSGHDKNAENIKPFPVVGIGASAGGIEAFSALLQHLPPNLGMAYILVQHLSPHHESFLPEILERKTKMKVNKVKNNMPVKKDNIYVISPYYGLTITDGKLKLFPRVRGEKGFHSIDYFFTDLANVYKENAIGIILSGSATDGTLGLKAIKAEGGVTFAQDDTARYTSMPQHAAEMGYVDFVLPPDKIAAELALIIKHPYRMIPPGKFLEKNEKEFQKIHAIMHSRRNIDFSHYKKTTIHRRIMRRMLLHHLKDLNDYIQLLRNDEYEVNNLYQDLLITVTNFFRDPHIFKALNATVLPALLENRKPHEPIRFWVPGCATGEEAVSMAIVLIEYMEANNIKVPIQIFATDLNEKAIEKARTGIYTKNALHNVSPERLKRFFSKIDGHYQVIRNVREVCTFAVHNLLKDPPFSKVDVISCQNVLIYLEPPAQNRIMHTFHYALKPKGFLLLGKSETVGVATNLFRHDIYQKQLRCPGSC